MTNYCSVLVVDDDAMTRARLVSVFSGAGYHVLSACSAAQALLVQRVEPCDIVVTDWEMPDMDGPSLCRTLKSRDRDHRAYVMLLTVRRLEADIIAALGAGADDYLVKGISIEEMLSRMEVGRRVTRSESADH